MPSHNIKHMPKPRHIALMKITTLFDLLRPKPRERSLFVQEATGLRRFGQTPVAVVFDYDAILLRVVRRLAGYVDACDVLEISDSDGLEPVNGRALVFRAWATANLHRVANLSLFLAC